MTELIASHLDQAIQLAPVWGFLLIFIFMTVESSFIPFPSEVVMIPAGFLAYRGSLTTHIPALDLTLAILIGLAGSMAGAYINYYLSIWLGRPFLRRYGKYFFLSEQHLDRAEEIFRKYGDLATFVCRLLPAIRQLISIPAGLARMNLGRFTLFTALGAGIWTAILAAVGWYFGHLAGNMTSLEMVSRGKELIHKHYIWILVFLAVFIAAYLLIQKAVMKSDKAPADSGK
ncbi:MAG: DedA family protein [Lentisphaeria bacterium]|nr:DedA family protein [Lentisphaeria bacterium]